jgi:hypothetical protein
MLPAKQDDFDLPDEDLAPDINPWLLEGNRHWIPWFVGGNSLLNMRAHALTRHRSGPEVHSRGQQSRRPEWGDTEWQEPLEVRAFLFAKR